MTFQDATVYIESFINHELYLDQSTPKTFSLDNMKRLLAALNHPEKDLYVVHIAGSKGKGSTAAMTASVLEQAGFSVGLYTSPHIYNVRERIRVLRKSSIKAKVKDLFPDQISEEDYAVLVENLKPVLEKVRGERREKPLSYFEVLTALALCYFQQQKTDVVILETGLGGRLDATNAVDSKICVITPISYEHTKLLGNSLTEIAAEKAAIIKVNGQQVIVSEQVDEVNDVVHRRCSEFNINPCIVGEDIQYESVSQNDHGQVCHVRTRNTYENLQLSLLGAHQIINAATCIGIVEALFEQKFEISRESVYKGLSSVSWPGRMEVMAKSVRTVFDGAHNRSSARFLAGCLKMMFPKGNVTIVLGVLKDKDCLGICDELKHVANKLIATEAQHPRAYHFSKGELEKVFTEQPCFYTQSVEDALNLAYKETPEGGAVVITGSIFVVGEARGFLED
ncbi:MAG: bifunctional folylpolyglutamate synthase/dihydrofolate synthase [Candidatus Omnitrophica bacterium]|nr:bifunctional folylpolyglutamate synthase/dihydrofolate synthase [Candidatus Omnitrophota bacterium]